MSTKPTTRRREQPKAKSQAKPKPKAPHQKPTSTKKGAKPQRPPKPTSTTPNPGGAPPKLTDEVSDAIVTMLERGITIEIACIAAGISDRSFHRWMDIGRKENTDLDTGTAKAEPTRYCHFWRKVTRARAVCEDYLVTLLRQHAVTDPRSAQFLLERMFTARYGRQVQITGTGEEGALKIEANPQPAFVINLPGVFSIPRIDPTAAPKRLPS